MVSWGEILFTVTAAGYLLGRKELPKLGRFIGLYSGRSVGAIVRAKNEFFDATKDHEIVKLQREFQKGIAELNEIRSELTSVGSMARPHQPDSSKSMGPRAAQPLRSFQQHSNGGAGPGPDVATAAASSAASSQSATPMTTTSASIRPSMADADRIEALSNQNVKRSEVASLALAELKLGEKGGYASRIESLEGGADYVAASIVDSLLMEPIGSAKTESVSVASTRLDESNTKK